MNRCLFVLLVACACPSKKASGPAVGTGSGVAGSGEGSSSGSSAASTCESTRPKVEQLYRALAEVKEPKRVEEAVADNVRMVINDCVKDPAKFAPCIVKVQSVADLEKLCLVPLDDEGTEGEAQKR